MPNFSATNSFRAVAVLAVLGMVTALLYFARAILIPFALATLLAFILLPVVNVLQRRGLGRIPSVMLAVVGACAMLGVMGWVIGGQIGGLVNNLPRYRDNIAEKVRSLRGTGEDGMWAKVQQVATDISKNFSERDRDGAGNADTSEPQPAQPGAIPGNPLYVTISPSGLSRLADAAGPAAEWLASAFLVVVLVVFMLIQRENLRNRLVRLIGNGSLIATTRALDEAARRVSRFLLMQVLVNALFGTAIIVSLLVLSLLQRDAGVNETLRRTALLWGFLGAILRFIPYLGTWLAAALLFGFSLATFPGFALPLTIFGIFAVFELLAANALEPLLFGHSTGSSPLALLLATAFWAWLWGPVGLLLATPITVMLVVVSKYVPQLHFLEVLLGEESALQPHVVLYQRLVAKDQDEASDLVDEFLQDHSTDDAFEQLMIPALALAKHDREREELDEADAHFVYQAMRVILDDMPLPQPRATPTEATARVNVVLGCPARDEADEVALAMFARTMESQGRTVEILSAATLTGEVLDKVNELAPAAIVIASLPPRGLTQTRYLCKRIKAQFPAIKVIVGRWGELGGDDRVRERLKANGADLIATTLAETRSEVLPLLHVTASSAPIPKADTELVASR